MLNPPSDDLPLITGFPHLPFGTIRPILILVQHPPGNRNLLTITTLWILRLVHSAGITAAASDQA